MEPVTQAVTAINDVAWGPPMLVQILGTGLLRPLRLQLMPVFSIGTGFTRLWRGRTPAAGARGEYDDRPGADRGRADAGVSCRTAAGSGRHGPFGLIRAPCPPAPLRFAVPLRLSDPMIIESRP